MTVHRLHIRKQNERRIVPTLYVKFCRFRFSGKSKKRILDRGFLSSDVANLGINSERATNVRYFFSKNTRNDNTDALRYSFLKSKVNTLCFLGDCKNSEL